MHGGEGEGTDREGKKRMVGTRRERMSEGRRKEEREIGTEGGNEVGT